jgi:hypothetical protein
VAVCSASAFSRVLLSAAILCELSAERVPRRTSGWYHNLLWQHKLVSRILGGHICWSIPGDGNLNSHRLGKPRASPAGTRYPEWILVLTAELLLIVGENRRDPASVLHDLMIGSDGWKRRPGNVSCLEASGIGSSLVSG